MLLSFDLSSLIESNRIWLIKLGVINLHGSGTCMPRSKQRTLLRPHLCALPLSHLLGHWYPNIRSGLRNRSFFPRHWLVRLHSALNSGRRSTLRHWSFFSQLNRAGLFGCSFTAKQPTNNLQQNIYYLWKNLAVFLFCFAKSYTQQSDKKWTEM